MGLFEGALAIQRDVTPLCNTRDQVGSGKMKTAKASNLIGDKNERLRVSRGREGGQQASGEGLTIGKEMKAIAGKATADTRLEGEPFKKMWLYFHKLDGMRLLLLFFLYVLMCADLRLNSKAGHR